MKFMILYQLPVSAGAEVPGTSPSEMQANASEWVEWRRIAGEGRVEFGAPLEAKNHIEGAEVSESHNQTSGYSIITAPTLDDALDMLRDHPHLKRQGAAMELLEFMEMPD